MPSLGRRGSSPAKTMKISLQTLMALNASVALVLTSIRSSVAGIALLAFVIPFAMIIIGLTSPQKCNQLDPSKRWYFFVLAKTWVFTILGLILATSVFAASPYLRDRCVRGLKGDSRRYQITLWISGSRKVYDELTGRRLVLYDSKGFLGEIRNVGCSETIQNQKFLASQIWLIVSTDRQDALARNHKEFAVDIRTNGSIYISE